MDGFGEKSIKWCDNVKIAARNAYRRRRRPRPRAFIHHPAKRSVSMKIAR